MKTKIFACCICLMLFVSLFATENEKAEEKINMDELSETLGHLIVRHLVTANGFTFSFDKIIKGMRDEKEGKAAPLSEEQYEQMISLMQEKLFEEAAIKNLSQANLFLEENRTLEKVISLEEKLQYKVEELGQGDLVVTASSTPLIHYEGKLLDGTLFASSHANNAPIALPMGQTIEGFHKGLVGMKEGEKRTLYIHPDLAYGVEGHLPPNSLLIFEVSIVKVDTKEEVAAETSSVQVE